MIDSQTLIDAEKLVLSQAMDGSLAFADLRDKGISRQTFSLPAHQQIWTALETVAGTGGTVDALTVIARLEAQGQLDAVGGHAGVVETATYGALARYKTAAALEMVTEAAKKHALLAFASRMAEAAGEADGVGLPFGHGNAATGPVDGVPASTVGRGAIRYLVGG